MRLAYNPLVEDDLADAASFYESRSPGLGEDFLIELRQAVDGVCAMPERWERVEGSARRCLLERFLLPCFIVTNGSVCWS